MASSGTFTDAARIKLGNASSGSLGPNNVNASRMRLFFFRIGEGGVTAPGVGVRSPVDAPDPALTDIQATAKSVYFFEKAFVGGEVVDNGAGLVTITVSLASGEGETPNGVFPNAGGDPEYSECGLFDEAGTMIAYFTFPPDLKGPASVLIRTFNINYAT